MKVAKEQAELLKQREDILCITLYGSLTGGDLTQFSDSVEATGKLPTKWGK